MNGRNAYALGLRDCVKMLTAPSWYSLSGSPQSFPLMMSLSKLLN